MKDLSKYYFLKNKDWYYFDSETHRLRLTDKAPKEAVESYKKFYKDKEDRFSESGD